jgi:hypothetical protein
LAASVSLTEANTARCHLVAPLVQKPETLHIILEVRDGGSPNLVAYRRAILTIRPADAQP